MFGLVVSDGIKWQVVIFHCLNLQIMNGMKWDIMEHIPSHTIQSFNLFYSVNINDIIFLSNVFKALSRYI